MSKNIVICFDGTWNTADAKYPTNVVKTAQLVAHEDEKGDEQAIFYDEGVGSSRTAFANTINRLLGGAFGAGLMDSIERAYRNLILNYSPGDRIFIFGFSRGAFGARSFGGLLANSGILHKDHIRCAKKAIQLYRDRDPDLQAEDPCCVAFRTGKHCVASYRHTDDEKENPRNHALAVDYVGIWDTVGSLGIPNGILLAHLWNRRYRFHDTDLSPMVKSARHVLAIDEQRLTFKPTPWTNLEKLNRAAGVKPGDNKPEPYQQVWFPGDHASVGGGGLYNGLWEAALTWVVAGARDCGLAIREDKFDEYARNIKHRTRVDSIADGSFQLSAFSPRRWRDGPNGKIKADLAEIGVKRLQAATDDLDEGMLYRPHPLEQYVKQFGEEIKVSWR